MSYCREEGKDRIVVLTKEDYNTPGEKPPILLEDEDDGEPGLILPTGEINWNCPCLGGMASGPCGVDFREAFSCFHYSKADPKGSDCYDAFSKMQECMVQYPKLYPMNDDDDDDDELGKALDELAKEGAKQDVDDKSKKSDSKS